MDLSSNNLQALFTGEFILSPDALRERLKGIKAYVLDWDGVFNDGFKADSGSSPYNEIDSMGSNLMRFSHHLATGTNPVFAVVTGENNHASFHLARREHFHAVYFKILHKSAALEHLCAQYGLQPSEVAFVFDDALDLSAARISGLRIMVPHASNPLFREFVLEQGWVDYITGCDGSQNAVRETCELFMGLRGNYAEAVTHRMNFSERYKTYLAERQAVQTAFYTADAQQAIQPATV